MTRAWSIAARVTTWFAVSLAGVAVAVTVVHDRGLATLLDEQVDRSLAEKISVVEKILREDPGNLAVLRHEVEWEWTSNAYARFWLRVVEPRTGRVLAHTPGFPAFAAPGVVRALLSERRQLRQGRALTDSDGHPFRALALLVPLPAAWQGADEFEVHAVWDFARDSEVLSAYRRQLVLVLALVLAMAIPAGRQLARRATAAVDTMSRTVQELGAATLHRRLAESDLPSELLALAGTFNSMLDRLEESFDRLSRFSSDIAHELRTPLNNLRGIVEVALSRERTPERYREVMGSALEECERLGHIVDRLLFLARAESPQNLPERRVVRVTGGRGHGHRRGDLRRAPPACLRSFLPGGHRSRHALGRRVSGARDRGFHRAPARRHGRDRELSRQRHHRARGAARCGRSGLLLTRRRVQKGRTSRVQPTISRIR